MVSCVVLVLVRTAIFPPLSPPSPNSSTAWLTDKTKVSWIYKLASLLSWIRTT